MKIKRLELNQKLEIEQIEYLEILMKDFGAIMAGGTAFEFFKGEKIKDHLDSHPTTDIDLYFESRCDYEEAVEFLKSVVQNESEFYKNRKYLSDISIEKSVTGLCYNFIQNEIKYQLVGCIFGKPEKIISSFDFKNLEVCYYFDVRKKIYQCLHSDIAKNTVELEIRHTRSPFLMHRIYKYLNYRGFKSVSESSKAHVTDWLIKASSGYYYENTDNCPSIYVDLVDNYFVRKILPNRDLISDDDLVYLIGKIKEKEYEIQRYLDVTGYSRSDFIFKGTRDLAIEEMQKRSKNAS